MTMKNFILIVRPSECFQQPYPAVQVLGYQFEAVVAVTANATVANNFLKAERESGSPNSALLPIHMGSNNPNASARNYKMPEL